MNRLEANEGIIESFLDEQGFYASSTSGTSMRPLFKTGRDVILIKKAENRLKKFDVALYKSPVGKYTLHRVIGFFDEGYLIRGDNTFTVERVPYESVLGVLVEFNRKGKKHTVEEKGYIFYYKIWNFIYPLRFLIHYIRSIAVCAVRKIIKLLSKK